MSVSAPPALDVAELTRLLQSVESGALFVPPRILRRIIKEDRRLKGIGLQVPHRKSYVVDRETLLRLAARAELQLNPGRGLPKQVILLTSPDPERLARLSREDALLKYWRLLFHAQVHVSLEKQLASGSLTEARVRQRICQIGQTEFDEVRSVLQQENFLLPPNEDRSVYLEFAAVFLELWYFARPLLVRYFPALKDLSSVRRTLAQDVDDALLLGQSCLPGAPKLPEFEPPEDRAPDLNCVASIDSPQFAPPREGDANSLMDGAQRAALRRNNVRAAIRYFQASQAKNSESVVGSERQARLELERLAGRLHDALGPDSAQPFAWLDALTPLLGPASSGRWPVEARLLYDLQKVCIDHERELYTVDLVSWAITFGRRPIKRPVPSHQAVLLVKHLRSAVGRVGSVRLSDPARQRLAGLLHEALRFSEERLRHRLRPLIAGILDEVGLKAQNLAEASAATKLIEELLDRAVERGYLTVGDLRDALSRNQLKLPDLAGPVELWRGDQLLRADYRLGWSLEGVYHAGEVYLRGLQRLSALAFGTRVGRFLTRYLALPYGIAYVAIEGGLHLAHLIARLGGRHPGKLDAAELGGSVILLGTFLFCVFHLPVFRSQVINVLRVLGGLVRGLLYDVPLAVLRLPAIRAVVESKPFLVFQDIVLKPLIITGVIGLVLPLYGVSGVPAGVTLAILFVVVDVFLHTRLGRTVEEAVSDALVRLWLRLSVQIFPALFEFTMGLFRGLVERVERALYTVDEWLRFRTGESRFSLAYKAVLGLVWFFITYLVRIYVNLLIEPTVNPIKHFPVVTVAAKLILPLLGILEPWIAHQLAPLGRVLAHSLAALNLLLLPGVFGFLVWELKENWKLYRANRARNLRPVVVGHHGETIARLLKPGFHSGTIPKLFAKLRRVERRAQSGGRRGRTKHAYHEDLHHIEEVIRRFVERNFLLLVNRSQLVSHLPIAVGKINIGSNRIGIELCRAEGGLPSAWLAFEERSDWLVATIVSPGWLARLSDREQVLWSTALGGLYKFADVELIREQLEKVLSPDKVTFDILPEGLVVWPVSGFEALAIYHLSDGQPIKTSAGDKVVVGVLPALDPDTILFRQVPISWQSWVNAWEFEQAGKQPMNILPPAISLLPGSIPS